MKSRIFALLAILVPLAACTATMSPKQRAERAARVQAAALAPISHINLINNSFYAWYAINDHQIVAYMTPTRAYLLDLPQCPGLEHSTAIVVTSRMGQVSTNFDSVIPSLVRVPCQIRQIRPLDIQRLKAPAVKENMNVEVEPRPAHANSRPSS